MEVTTTARHFDLPEAVRAHGEEKLRRLSRYFDQIQGAAITITKEKFRYKTDITLTSGAGGDFASSEETDDPSSSLDGAISALESQIKRHKGRLIDRREKRSKTGEAFAEAAEADAAEADEGPET